jgi:putative ABC transport system permease protein
MTYRLKLASRYLGQRRQRTLLTTLSIVVGVMLIFGLNGLVPALEQSLNRGMLADAGRADLTLTSESQGVFDQALVGRAAQAPGVAAAAGQLIRPLALPDELALAGLSSVTVHGLAFEAAERVRPFTLITGRGLVDGDEDGLLLTATLSRDSGLAVGDSMRLPAVSGSADFTVVGLIEDPQAVAGDDLYLSLAAAQALLGLSDQINAIEVRYAAGVDPAATTLVVLDALGPGFQPGVPAGGSQFTTSLEIAGPVFTFFGLLVLVMAGFIILNTFRTVVAERQRDIALLRAVGATRRDVTAQLLTEGLLQGIAGTLLGLIAGYLFVQGLLAAMSQVWLQRVNFPLGQARFTWPDLLLAVLLGVGVTLVGGLLPALTAARVSPVEALRPSMAQVMQLGDERSWRRRLALPLALILLALLGLGSGQLALASLGLLLFLAALFLLSPLVVTPVSVFFGRLLATYYGAEGTLAQANLVRQPGRAAVTVSAMMIGLAILLALTGMVTAVTVDVTGFIDQSLGGDFLLMPRSQVLSSGNVGAGPELAQALRQTPGIAAVTTLRATSALANGQGVQVMGLDPASYPLVAGLSFVDGDPAAAYQSLGQGRSLIANTIYASRHGVQVGDMLTMTAPDGAFNYRVVGIATDYLNAQVAAVFLSQANLAADFNESTDLLLMADQNAGADAGQIRRQLAALAEPYPALTLFGPGEYSRQILNQGYFRLAIFYVLLAFVVVPSLFALANTLGISVIERTREVGMLRAVGATRRQVRRLITAESLLLAAIGIILGILAGLWLGYLLVQGLNAFGYPVHYTFPWTGVLLAVAVGLLLALLAALLPGRAAARMNIVRALQYE